ncbi:MAG: hypothetical protein U9O18_02195 [Chloroflexota bacterium]|nr:hypothetical protein [Chloroflexota bacterium]
MLRTRNSFSDSLRVFLYDWDIGKYLGDGDAAALVPAAVGSASPPPLPPPPLPPPPGSACR